jgi:hypothetical protein
VFIGSSYQNARWLPADYDGEARFYAQEMLHLDNTSARTPSPRIIFAGGSSVIYAVDAKAIERALGVPVINMAMSARIGSDANYLDYLLPHIRKGDLVIYTNHGWLVDLTQDAEANRARAARRLADRLWVLAKVDLRERNHVEWPLLLPIPDTPIFKRLNVLPRVNPAPPIRQRDDHGGIVRCPAKSGSFRPIDAPSAAPDRKVIARSGEFVSTVESRGADVIFFETPILITARERENWSRYRKELRLQLSQVAPVLDATETRIFSADIDRFCDSNTHVDDDIRVEWSLALSAQLRQLPAVQALVRTKTGVAPIQPGYVAKFTHLQVD